MCTTEKTTQSICLTNTEKQKLYNEAIAFYELAECGRINIPERKYVESHIPYIINMLFCSELLLKFLLVEEGKSIKEVESIGHDLKSLYDNLFVKTKENIYCSFKHPLIYDIDVEMEQIKNSFVNWRYLVLNKAKGKNNKLQLKPYFLKELNEVLIAICKSHCN